MTEVKNELVSKLEALGFEAFLMSNMRVETISDDSDLTETTDAPTIGGKRVDILQTILHLELPWYLHMNGRTVVVTENDGYWIRRGEQIDLRPHGFHPASISHEEE